MSIQSASAGVKTDLGGCKAMRSACVCGQGSRICAATFTGEILQPVHGERADHQPCIECDANAEGGADQPSEYCEN